MPPEFDLRTLTDDQILKFSGLNDRTAPYNVFQALGPLSWARVRDKKSGTNFANDERMWKVTISEQELKRLNEILSS